MGTCSSIPEHQTIRDEIREIEHGYIKPKVVSSPKTEPPDFQWVS